MTQQGIRVVLVDDHALFRSGIRLLLARVPEFEVVGEASDATEGIKCVRQHSPDVVLLDLNMPGMPGCEAARLISTETPDTHVLMLTVSEDADDLFEALRSGACGYLVKNIEAEALVAAVRSAANGESVISPQMMGKLLARVREGDAASDKGGAPVASTAPQSPAQGEHQRLTRREREILGFLVRGQSNKEIARELNLAESTVKIHVQNLLRKLKLSSRVQAAVYAVEQGLVSPDEAV